MPKAKICGIACILLPTSSAYPENMSVLDRLAAKRYELANMFGYRDVGGLRDCRQDDQSLANASDFIDKDRRASGERAANEYQELLERKQQDEPGATVINRWESAYYSELVRKTNYNFDSQSVRPYFPYERVKQGVFDVTGKLFGVNFEQVEKCGRLASVGRMLGNV